MKLITEMSENLELKEELNEATGEKSLYITGPFMQAEQKNRNGRIYPLETLSREVQRYTTENIVKNRAYGELGHPQGPTINLDRVSHMIKELKQSGNDFIGKAKIMDTPMGNIVKNLMKEGAGLGVSSRGMGSLKESRNGSIVQEDFHLATPADIVADPSAPDAYVDGIMENVEWLFSEGIGWERVELNHKQREAFKKASVREIQEAKLAAFKSFINGL